ncbi:hypothetical protein E4U42_004192 [Claviceps africana]|uniref:Acid phosphatase-like protein n=1 Tax=Claviceps africana TaxID=83212 RepID=A0A8K0J5I8_9HYPO|nr:hypothetical protein E4U42_004192 [Claviceps africana]
MVSTVGGIVIALVVLLVVAAGGWAVFTQIRARRLGLPVPSLSSYLPWKRSENPYGPPQPAPGGVVGWFNDQVRKVKNRNNRSAAGAYEEPLHGADGAAGRRGFGPLDPDEAWDARVGHEADGYGYLEEAELGRRGPTEYAGGASYNLDLAATPGTPYDEQERRHGLRGRDLNPFDDDAVSSLRGVSPRPIDTAAAQKQEAKADKPGDSAGTSPTNKRSAAPTDGV